MQVLLVGDKDRLKGDAALAATKWGAAVDPAGPAGLGGADIIVDALFGAGLDRPVEGVARAMIEAMNAHASAHGVPIVAVDLPSGINGTSGAVMGTAVKANRSVTFFRKKPGHLLLPGRLHCGTTTVADIGISDAVLAKIAPQTFENLPELWRGSFPVPRHQGQKYDRGHAVVVSGPSWSTGGRAARRPGGAPRWGGPRDHRKPRGMRWPSTPRQALPSWCGRSMTLLN